MANILKGSLNRAIVPLLLILVLAVLVLVLVGRRSGASAGPPQTVLMSMSDYTFNGNNPTLTLRPGQRVRFIVRNDETSMVRHNFRIVGLDVPCERELLPGETREVTVTMPRSGEFAYTCCTHPGMGGKLVIGSR